CRGDLPCWIGRAYDLYCLDVAWCEIRRAWNDLGLPYPLLSQVLAFAGLSIRVCGIWDNDICVCKKGQGQAEASELDMPLFISPCGGPRWARPQQFHSNLSVPGWSIGAIGASAAKPQG